MRKLAQSLILGLLLCSPLRAQLKSFPTAEGFGAFSVGGRGGTVVHVTNLADSGAGSFRTAVTSTGPRIVVFDVSGTILINSLITLRAEHSFLTIAGQTSPGGIQIRSNDKNGVLILQDAIHDVIIRHLRVRPGAPAPGSNNGNNIVVFGNAGAGTVRDIIIDHCSLQWGNDEMASNYGDATEITWQWNIIAEGSPTLPGASYGMGNGGSSSSGAQNRLESIHHNLFAHNGGRSPEIGISGITDFVNNVIYNWGSAAAPTYVGQEAMAFGLYTLNTSVKGNFVKNHYISGPNSAAGNNHLLLQNGGPTRLNGSAADRGGTKVYVEGNWTPNCPSGCANDWNNVYIDIDAYYNNGGALVQANEAKFRTSTRFSAPAITEHATSALKAAVLATVGAYKPSRDQADTDVVNDATNGTGNIANIGNGGPWPTLTGGSPPTDTDSDGMSDVFEDANSLNKNSAADANLFAANGWTNIENYINGLAGDTISGGAGLQISVISPTLGDSWKVGDTHTITWTGPPNPTPVSQQFNVTGTWLAPTGVSSVQVDAWGGGGAGGGNTTNADGGGGGGGGAFSRKTAVAVTAGNTYTVTVGARGVGGSGNGTAGRDSWFNTSGTVLAKGGGFGAAPVAGAGGLLGAGGQASSGIGDTKFSGGSGGAGRDNNAGTGGGGGGSGGPTGAGGNGTSGTASVGGGGAAGTGTPGGGAGGAGGDNTPAVGSGPGGGGGGSGDPGNGAAGADGSVIITWTTPDNCKIELSRNNGSSWEDIIASTPCDGSYDWTVAGSTTVQGIIRISSLAGGGETGNSTVFTIASSVTPTITVTSPVSGQNFRKGESVLIGWNSTNLSGNVRIDVSFDNGTTWETVISSVAFNASGQWIANPPASSLYKVRVVSLNDTSIVGTMTGNFRVRGSILAGVSQ